MSVLGGINNNGALTEAKAIQGLWVGQVIFVDNTATDALALQDKLGPGYKVIPVTVPPGKTVGDVVQILPSF